MAEDLPERLRDRIRRDGPLPFADWMQACLYDPDGGFYARRGQGHPAGTGQGTHFATSPTLHPFFAEAVAADLAEAWRRAGSPASWTVAEFGAGTGALARDASAALRGKGVPAEWVAVDVRPGPASPGVRWSATAPERFDAAVANEFLDALPFDLHEWRGAGSGSEPGPGPSGGWRRVGVGLGPGDEGVEPFAWAELGASRVRLPAGREEERRVVMPGLPLWVDAVARAGARFALVADYGSERPASGARAFRGHAHADPLDEPGTADLTADVDFAALQAHAARNGFSTSSETQESFLLRHGVLDALNATDRSSVEGASSYLQLRQLLLPTGLGAAFKVARLQRDG